MGGHAEGLKTKGESVHRKLSGNLICPQGDEVERWMWKQMEKVSNFPFYVAMIGCNEINFYCKFIDTAKNQLTPKQIQDSSSTWMEHINHPIAPIQFKSENNTHWDSNWGFSLRFKYQNYDTFLWCKKYLLLSFLERRKSKKVRKFMQISSSFTSRKIEGGHFYVWAASYEKLLAKEFNFFSWMIKQTFFHTFAHKKKESHSLQCNWIRSIFNKSEMRAHLE